MVGGGHSDSRDVCLRMWRMDQHNFFISWIGLAFNLKHRKIVFYLDRLLGHHPLVATFNWIGFDQSSLGLNINIPWQSM